MALANIKFIREIMSAGHTTGEVFGNYIIYDIGNKEIAKVYIGDSDMYSHYTGVTVKIIHKLNGEIDACYFPFSNYFKPVQCSSGDRLWYQYVDGDEWYFSQYEHVLPTPADFANLANAVERYIELFERGF